MTVPIQIQPSLLAADFGHLEAGARLAQTAGGDALHIDIMDGHFVPNLSMGPDVVAMARHAVSVPLVVHLMLSNPEAHLRHFAQAGASLLLIHIEIAGDVRGTLRRIRALGVRPGITLNPETPAAAVYGVLDEVDEVLCMSVHPGYGGQHFLPEVLPKLTALRTEIGRRGLPVDLSVDGGIDLGTGPEAARAGANVLVAGTALYRAPDMAAAIADLRRAAAAAREAPA
jgi:ribulose-phosphate 3-epimerase